MTLPVTIIVSFTGKGGEDYTPVRTNLSPLSWPFCWFGWTLKHIFKHIFSCGDTDKRYQKLSRP